MNEQVPQIITDIDQETESDRLDDCIITRDNIVSELIDREAELPKNIMVFTCGNNSKNDPHFWLEVHLGGGQVLIWDQTKQKLGNNLTPLDEAEKVWSDYAKPNQRMQIIPSFEE